jgi:ATP-dependent RNA helicase RhlB
VQIAADAEQLGRYCHLVLHSVYGGVAYKQQLETLKEGVDVLIGTPGRLIDYYKQKAFSLKDTRVLVVDEADRMFDMGFIDDIRFLIRRMPDPTKRQSFLYSATLSHRVLELAYEHMNEAQRVVVSENKVTADNITQIVYHVGQPEKFGVLLGLLEHEKPSRGLVFVNTRSIASELAERLEQHGYRAGALAGDVDQRKRLKLLQRFKDNDLQLLVATDVASRGLHIESVTHVFNYDLPQDPEDYVHRIGRTARAGASGKAVSLACEHYVYSLEAIEEFIGHKIPHQFPDEELFVKPLPYRRRRRERTAVKPSGPERSRARGRRRRGVEGAKSHDDVRGAEKPPAKPLPAATGASPDDGAPAKKRRRRSRRRRKAAKSAAGESAASTG